MAALRAELLRLKDWLRPHHGAGCDAFHRVMVRPCLRWALVPAPRPKRERERSAHQLLEADIGALVDDLLPPAPAGAGLVEGSKSDTFPPDRLQRHGMAGLPGAGVLAIEDFCSLSRQEKSRFAMWTVTIPAEVGSHLEGLEDGWPRFQDVLRRKFSQALKRSCERESRRLGLEVKPHWAFVVEVQENGRPHLHFVFRSKGASGRRWLLSKGRLDQLIRHAIYAVTGRRVSCKAAGNVQTLRRDPGSYLSSYLKKGRLRPGAEAIMAAGYSLNMVPKQWWGRSAAALEWTREHTFSLPRRLVGWLSLHWPELMADGALVAKLIELPGEGAPTVVCGRWRGVGGLWRVIEAIELAVVSAAPAAEWASCY